MCSNPSPQIFFFNIHCHVCQKKWVPRVIPLRFPPDKTDCMLIGFQIAVSNGSDSNSSSSSQIRSRKQDDYNRVDSLFFVCFVWKTRAFFCQQTRDLPADEVGTAMTSVIKSFQECYYQAMVGGWLSLKRTGRFREQPAKKKKIVFSLSVTVTPHDTRQRFTFYKTAFFQKQQNLFYFSKNRRQ